MKIILLECPIKTNVSVSTKTHELNRYMQKGITYMNPPLYCIKARTAQYSIISEVSLKSSKSWVVMSARSSQVCERCCVTCSDLPDYVYCPLSSYAGKEGSSTLRMFINQVHQKRRFSCISYLSIMLTNCVLANMSQVNLCYEKIQ